MSKLPTCPNCAVEGVEHIDSADSSVQNNKGEPWFQIAFCKECGHIYNIFHRTVISQPIDMNKVGKDALNLLGGR